MKRVKFLALILILTMVLGSTSYACTKDFEGKVKVDSDSFDVKIQGNGDTLLVFESGYGDTYDVWDLVVAQLDMTQYTVLRYNRAGFGNSDISDQSLTVDHQAKTLNKLLKKVGLNKKSLILIAHSYGALIAREYAQYYGKYLEGVVLVDGSHEKQEEVMIQYIPEEYLEMYYAQFSVEASYAEFLESLSRVAEDRTGLEGKELSILTATQHGLPIEGELQWQELQSDYASLSSKSVGPILVEGGHYIHVESPQYVVTEINRIETAIH